MVPLIFLTKNKHLGNFRYNQKMKQYTKLTNGRVITPSGIKKGWSILFCNEQILEIGAETSTPAGTHIIDLKGKYAAPGCIDIHVHGGGAHNFTENSVEAYVTAAQAHAEHGTTALYATLEANPTSQFKKCFDTFAAYDAQRKEFNCARILGLHLEGNYINRSKKGALPPQYIKNPDEEEYKELLAYTDCIKRWTFAPELPGAMEFADYARSRGVVLSLGHTESCYPEVERAYNHGVCLATHFYNAMIGVHTHNGYKREGTIESVFAIPGLDVEVITDGIHIPLTIIKHIYQTKGADHMALITDSMDPAGMKNPEEYNDGYKQVIEGVCKLMDGHTLAGSIATFDQLIRTCLQAGLPLEDVIKMCSATPAKIMGIDKTKGSLIPGYDADIICFDEEINIQSTWVEGKLVFKA